MSIWKFTKKITKLYFIYQIFKYFVNHTCTHPHSHKLTHAHTNKHTHTVFTHLHSFSHGDQSISLGLLRSDLMLESSCCADNDKKRPYCCWKQVEINTIASGFGHLGPISRELQRLFTHRFFIPSFYSSVFIEFFIFYFSLVKSKMRAKSNQSIENFELKKIDVLNWVFLYHTDTNW